MKRHQLRRLTIKELSNVKRGANQGALHVLRKSGLGSFVAGLLGKGADDEEELDLSELSDALVTSVSDILEKSETPEELEANLTATFDQFKIHLVKGAVPPGKKKAVAGDEPADDGSDENDQSDDDLGKSHQETDDMRSTLLKGLHPEAVAYVTSLEKQVKDAQDGATAATALANQALEKQATSERRAHALTLIGKSAPISLDDAVALLKSAEAAQAAGDPKAVERMETLLKKQAALVEKSALFEEAGTDHADSPNAGESALAKRAEELRKNNPKLSIAKAMSMAMEENPDAYEDALDGESESIEA